MNKTKIITTLFVGAITIWFFKTVWPKINKLDLIVTIFVFVSIIGIILIFDYGRKNVK